MESSFEWYLTIWLVPILMLDFIKVYCKKCILELQFCSNVELVLVALL